MALAGIALTVLSASWLVAAWLRAPREHCFGPSGWAGLGLFAACALLLAVPTHEPPFIGALAWTGYVLIADSAAYAVRGRSLLRSNPEGFLWLAVLSIFLWLPFEWYNERLAAWYWAGLPPGPSRYLLLGWSHACIWPALYGTADLVWAIRARDEAPKGRAAIRAPQARWLILIAAVGAACLILPLVLPRLGAGEHLFALTGVGFLLLLDPLNLVIGRPSLLLDCLANDRSRSVALAVSGSFCGLMADCLNYRADAKWHSISSLGADFKFFELPVIAYLVFPFFGLQAFVIYEFVAGTLNMPVATLPVRQRRASESGADA